MENLLHAMIKKEISEIKQGVFKAEFIGPGETFVLQPGMMCIIRPSGKNLILCNAAGTQIIDSGMGFTLAFCCDLGEGGATGTSFRAFFAYEAESILELAATKGVILGEGAYFKNTHASTGIYVYYVKMPYDVE
ncbi:MAG: hypothetical protein IJ300_06980 [Clostridia bacterium]|nr:hypothetical protein [Clostridia bacterium]